MSLGELSKTLDLDMKTVNDDNILSKILPIA